MFTIHSTNLPSLEKLDTYDVIRVNSKVASSCIPIGRIRGRNFQGLAFIFNSDNEIWLQILRCEMELLKK